MANRETFKSGMDLAAGLPPDAPHILSVDQSIVIAPGTGEPSAVIDIDDFEDALRDPAYNAFAREAVAYTRELERTGRLRWLNQD